MDMVEECKAEYMHKHNIMNSYFEGIFALAKMYGKGCQCGRIHTQNC